MCNTPKRQKFKLEYQTSEPQKSINSKVKNQKQYHYDYNKSNCLIADHEVSFLFGGYYRCYLQ